MHMISCLGAGSSAILLLSDCLVAKIFLHIRVDFERCITSAIVHLDSVSMTVHTPFPLLSHVIVILVPTCCLQKFEFGFEC